MGAGQRPHGPRRAELRPVHGVRGGADVVVRRRRRGPGQRDQHAQPTVGVERGLPAEARDQRRRQRVGGDRAEREARRQNSPEARPLGLADVLRRDDLQARDRRGLAGAHARPREEERRQPQRRGRRRRRLRGGPREQPGAEHERRRPRGDQRARRQDAHPVARRERRGDQALGRLVEAVDLGHRQNRHGHDDAVERDDRGDDARQRERHGAGIGEFVGSHLGGEGGGWFCGDAWLRFSGNPRWCEQRSRWNDE
mmetsp:Transcript_14450/g.49839  ORF Transcript_14450/g.49839 Transcript_14450/m.49839 type:complete len:254 (+) Transcript_14450:2587-3348(+)